MRDQFLNKRKNMRNVKEKILKSRKPSGVKLKNAVALGALAFGVVAIGAIAIGRLVIKNATIKDLHVGSLTVDHLIIKDQPE
jgi:hypothetical protein